MIYTRSDEYESQSVKEGLLADEQIFRTQAIQIVKEMPFEELKKQLFRFKKIDPNSNYYQKAYDLKKLSCLQMDQIERLKVRNVIRFETTLDPY